MSKPSLFRETFHAGNHMESGARLDEVLAELAGGETVLHCWVRFSGDREYLGSWRLAEVGGDVLGLQAEAPKGALPARGEDLTLFFREIFIEGEVYNAFKARVVEAGEDGIKTTRPRRVGFLPKRRYGRLEVDDPSKVSMSMWLADKHDARPPVDVADEPDLATAPGIAVCDISPTGLGLVLEQEPADRHRWMIQTPGRACVFELKLLDPGTGEYTTFVIQGRMAYCSSQGPDMRAGVTFTAFDKGTGAAVASVEELDPETEGSQAFNTFLRLLLMLKGGVRAA